VELANTEQLFKNPRHPYTRALIASIPRMTAESINEDFYLEGDPPSPFNIPPGCRFNPRCAFAVEACKETDPALMPVSDAHSSACIRSNELPTFSTIPIGHDRTRKEQL
jgi:oligopeptide/dipeptide ABC transporter ATP-binding protein